MMTSINEDILDQWSAEQQKSVAADQVLLKWNKVSDKYTVLVTENKETKQGLDDLLEENNATRLKFTTLLDTFQQFILS
jgi:uncharacterized membrane protein